MIPTRATELSLTDLCLTARSADTLNRMEEMQNVMTDSSSTEDAATTPTMRRSQIRNEAT